MPRLIDADALIERLEVYPVYNGMADMDDIMTFVREMPTVNGWIKCTPDTMPETNDEVLTTYLYDNEPDKYYVESASYFDDGEGEGHWHSVWDEFSIGPLRKTTIAWMPMPKPYKPPKEENDAE